MLLFLSSNRLKNLAIVVVVGNDDTEIDGGEAAVWW